MTAAILTYTAAWGWIDWLLAFVAFGFVLHFPVKWLLLGWCELLERYDNWRLEIEHEERRREQAKLQRLQQDER